MATNLKSDDEPIPYLDELDPPIMDDGEDEVPLITAEDIARTQRRLEEGHDADAYHFGEMDLWVITRLTSDQWQQVKANPSVLTRVLAPTAHA